ncbi:unnamed protein product [Miscanthus lutarioriparius]|uniref:F-box domain-containing protein n=1 Tax=Miscanthus lutarioriparius TaxID=422564 RepID=A0A811SE73_9POAL|nr:unnamed protein product [Miscanthus lutarioriparius]
MEKKAGDAEIVEEDRGRAASSASTSSRKKRSAVDGASGACLCDNVICYILAYLPARTAIGCMALSKRHRDLIRSPEFRSLHCRLGAPLPRPHIAYIATASLRYKQYRGRVSEFHGFHVAGAGAGISSSNAPMRAIFGDSYLGYRCVNTCNGVVLLATNDYSPLGRCVLWNPAVADVVREFTVPADTSMEGGNVNYLVLGLGYGRRSETYKLLLFHMDYTHWKHSLQVYALVGGQPRLRPAVSSPPGIDGAIQSHSTWMARSTSSTSTGEAPQQCKCKRYNGGLKPIRDKDSREGPKAILDTVSFMEFLVSIMRKLPDVSENDSEDSEDDDMRGVVKIRIVSGSDSD